MTAAGLAASVGKNEVVAKPEILDAIKPSLRPVANFEGCNAGPLTAARLLEIAERNRILQEAGLPLLSLAQELRRMKKGADSVAGCRGPQHALDR